MSKLTLVTDLTGKQLIGEVEFDEDLTPVEDSKGFTEIRNPLLVMEGPAQMLAVFNPSIMKSCKDPNEISFLLDVPSKFIYMDSMNIKLNSYKFVDSDAYFKLQEGYKEILDKYNGVRDKTLEKEESD